MFRVVYSSRLWFDSADLKRDFLDMGIKMQRMGVPLVFPSSTLGWMKTKTPNFRSDLDSL